MASIFKRNDVWWVSYYHNGKQVRKSLKTSNKRIAEREKQALESKLLEPHSMVPKEKNPSVEHFWAMYLEHAQTQFRPTTIEIQSYFWKQLMEFTGAKNLGDIKQSDIIRFKSWMKKKGSSVQTINNALKDIRAIYNKAIKFGWYTGKEPTTGVERFKIARKMPEFHTTEELNRMLEEAKKHSRSMTWVVLLGAWAGFRKSEIGFARWEWFDFNQEQPIIHIKAYPGFQLKDNEDRSIPMHQKIWDALYPHRQKSGYIFNEEISYSGTYQYRYDPKKSLITILGNAGLTTKNPYQRLRQSFGSALAANGISIFKISKWMGHSSVQVTERHYAGLQAFDDDINKM